MGNLTIGGIPMGISELFQPAQRRAGSPEASPLVGIDVIELADPVDTLDAAPFGALGTLELPASAHTFQHASAAAATRSGSPYEALLAGKSLEEARGLIGHLSLAELERIGGDKSLSLHTRMLAAGVHAHQVAVASSGKVVPGLESRLEAAESTGDVAAVDKMLAGAGPAEMEALLASDLSPRAKAVLVEVCLRRAGTRTYEDLTHNPTWETVKPGYAHSGKDVEGDRKRAGYQSAAEAAIFDHDDGAEVFTQLSTRKSMIGTDRPASRLMLIVAQPGGVTRPEHLGRMLLNAPPEARGRMYFHLLDAANDAKKGKAEVRGVGIQGGIEAGPKDGPQASLGIGIDIEYHPKDSPWQHRVEIIGGYVIEDMRTGRPEQACEVERGMMMADRSYTGSVSTCAR